MPLSRRPSHGARGASSSPIDPIMMQGNGVSPSASRSRKLGSSTSSSGGGAVLGSSKSTASLVPDGIGDAPARGSSPAGVRTQQHERSEQEEELDVLAAAALTAAASAGWERERSNRGTAASSTPRRSIFLPAPSTPASTATAATQQHTPSTAATPSSRSMSFRRKTDVQAAPSSPSTPAPPVSGLARFFSTRRKARTSSVDARTAHDAAAAAEKQAVATPSPPVVISAQFARPASRSSSRAASPIQPASKQRRFSRSSTSARAPLLQSSPSQTDITSIEGIFEFPPRASRDSTRESSHRNNTHANGFAHLETQAPATTAAHRPSSRISHKPSRSVPLHLGTTPLLMGAASSQDSILLASAASPALSATSSTFKSRRTGTGGGAAGTEGTAHMRRRTSSLAGRLGAFFSGAATHADEAAVVAAATMQDEPTSPTFASSSASAAGQQEGRASTHGRSLSNRVGVPARLRGLSFGRRVHTSAGSSAAAAGEQGASLASAPATVSLASMPGFHAAADTAASPSAPSTTRHAPGSSSSAAAATTAGAPRRKLSLRRMRVSSRGQAEAPPLTPEIHAWRGDRRETLHDGAGAGEEGESEEEITRVGYLEAMGPALAAGPTPAASARTSPEVKEVPVWLDAKAAGGAGAGGQGATFNDATVRPATRRTGSSSARIAPPRYLPTPDLSGPPMDPRMLLREAGVQLTPSVSSHGEGASQRGSATSSIASEEAGPVTPPGLGREARLEEAAAHTTPKAAVETLEADKTPRRRRPSMGELQGLGLIVSAANSPREHIDSRYSKALAEKKKQRRAEVELQERLRSTSPRSLLREQEQRSGAMLRSVGGESEDRGAAFVTDLQAVRWDTVSDGAWSDGRTTPSTVRPRVKVPAPTALSVFTAQAATSADEGGDSAADTSLDSADGRRPYSLISNSSDGADTPLVAIRRLVVNTTDADAPETADLFFRPPSQPRSSNSATQSERTDSRRPSPEQMAEEFHALNEMRVNRNRSAYPANTTTTSTGEANVMLAAAGTPLVVSTARTEEAGSASPQDVLSPLPAGDEATPRSGSGGVGRRQHKRSSTALSGASRRTSVLDSDAGTGISDAASALEAEVSQARRMAAVPLGKARVAEWARKTRAVAPLQHEEEEQTRETRAEEEEEEEGEDETVQLPDIPDELSAGHSSPVVFQAPLLIVASPEPPSHDARPLPTSQEAQELERLAEAARLGKAPSKRIRRSQSQPMSSNDLHIAAAPALPPLPTTRSPTARARTSRGSLRASPARRSARSSARATGASEGAAHLSDVFSSPGTPTRALRPSQSGNLRAQAAILPPSASQPIAGSDLLHVSSSSLRKSRSAHASMSQAADAAAASLVTPTKKVPITPVNKALALSSVEAKRAQEASATATGSGFTERTQRSSNGKEASTSSSSKQHRSTGTLRKNCSYATSEEAILAKRKEQAEREQRHKERELKREEARQAAYARKKKSDPLLATRLALAGLSELDMHEAVPALPSSLRNERAESPRKVQLSPIRPDWELDIEPAYSVSISSAPIMQHVELGSPPKSRKALDRGLLTPDMAHSDLASPYGGGAPTSSAGSRASFHTAKDTPSDVESDDGTVAAAPSTSPPTLRHQFESPRADRPLTVASFATMSSAASAASLVALDFPVPPTRSNAQRSDDGTLLSRAGLRDASPSAPPRQAGEEDEEDDLPEPSWTRRAALRPEAEAQMKAARPEMAYAPRRSRSSDFRSAPPFPPPGISYASHSHTHAQQEDAGRKTPTQRTQQQQRKAPEMLLNLHGHARPISGRLAPSPEAKKATLVNDFALPSPAMHSERASVGSAFSEH